MAWADFHLNDQLVNSLIFLPPIFDEVVCNFFNEILPPQQYNVGFSCDHALPCCAMEI
jgi:hypothetical protein